MKQTKTRLAQITVFALSAMVTACGSSQEPQSDGMMTRINNQTIVLRDQVQQQEVCKTNYCEPNYILHEAFGSSRSNPAPAPVPVPAPPVPTRPTATPVPVPTKSAEVQDYSRSKMNMSEAWQVTEGDPSVIVAIIDSGIDLTHPDLKDNLWTNPGEVNGSAGTDNDGNGYKNDLHGYDFYYKKADPTDEGGHGSHVAGIIAALKNNYGSVGVAPRVKLMPLRFIGPDGSGSTSDAIDAIYYAIKMKANVISASWGGTGYSSILAQAVKDAQDAGIIFVAAAGNQSYDTTNTPYYPGSLPNVISVAASGQSDQLSSYSNFSATAVTIAAPGDDIYSTYLNGGYTYLSGTSMAAPQISGTIALALSKNKSFKPDYIQSALCSTSDQILKSVTKCGRVNVGRLLKTL